MSVTSSVVVLEQASTYDLTVLSTVKEELNISPSDTSQDAKLARWISEVSDQIATYCNRVFALERVQETFLIDSMWDHWQQHRHSRDDGQSWALNLARYPVANVLSVTVDGADLPASEYQVYEQAGLLFRLNSAGAQRSWSARRVVVVYSAGYQLLDGLPRNIEQAALLALKHRRSAGSRDPTIRGESLSGIYDVTYWVGSQPGSESALPPEAVSLLAKGKDLSVGIA